MKVTCIMPTANRPTTIHNAVVQFMQQSYQEKELIIVYDDKTDLPSYLSEIPNNVVYLKSHQFHKTIGDKRNLACSRATGDLIMFWDDDDISHPDRIRRQAEPIIKGEAHITGLTNINFFTVHNMKCWKAVPEHHASIFRGNIAGGTMMFRREVWDKVKFKPISLAEDAEFLKEALNLGYKLKKIECEDLFIYTRHSNTWKFGMGDGKWIETEPPEIAKNSISFYTSLRVAAKANPRVSCIMPTANRQKFIGKAVEQFTRQTYQNKELIIIDNGVIPSKDHFKPHPAILYRFKQRKITLGDKRNFCCSLATGDIIMHFDDDDFYSPDWVNIQVRYLMDRQADITGLSQLQFYDIDSGDIWEYSNPALSGWVAGATLAYWKDYWNSHHFPPVNKGEDTEWVLKGTGKVIPHTRSDHFLATIHNGNTSKRKVSDETKWKKVNASHPLIKVVS